MSADPQPQQPDEVQPDAVPDVRDALYRYLDDQADYADRGNISEDFDELWSYLGPSLASLVLAAPSAQPQFYEWSVQGYIGPTGWAPDGWTVFHGPYLDAQAAWRVYDGQRRLWNKGRTGRPVRLVRRSIGSVEVVHGGR